MITIQMLADAPDGPRMTPMELVKHVASRTGLPPQTIPDQAPSDRTLSSVAYIAIHYRKNIRLNEVAQVAGMSKYHFIRRFRAEIGMTPGALLRRLRIANALQLLDATQMSIAQVAAAIGYGDATAFSRVFMKVMNIQPYRYRQIRRIETPEALPPVECAAESEEKYEVKKSIGDD